jgi:hypothetical protein
VSVPALGAVFVKSLQKRRVYAHRGLHKRRHAASVPRRNVLPAVGSQGVDRDPAHDYPLAVAGRALVLTGPSGVGKTAVGLRLQQIAFRAMAVPRGRSSAAVRS